MLKGCQSRGNVEREDNALLGYENKQVKYYLRGTGIDREKKGLKGYKEWIDVLSADS